MARTKLNTDLAASAKKSASPKSKKPKNGDDSIDEFEDASSTGSIFDETEDSDIESDDDIQQDGDSSNSDDEDMPANLSEEETDGGGPYTMGDITYDGDDSENNAPKTDDSSKNEDDEDVIWVDDEVSMEDKDPYLDMEDYDIDNPENDNFD